MRRVKQVKPNYINIKINERKPQDKTTIINVTKFRINQEIRFLYCKKQNLNQRLYHLHLAGARQYNGMRQHIQDYTDTQISRLMDNLYQKLNRKLDALANQTCTKHNNNQNASRFEPRLNT